MLHMLMTLSITLKEKICDILYMHNFDVSNIRGQGYDDSSNMRGQCNSLQILFMKDCPFGYYVSIVLPIDCNLPWFLHQEN
jgi:hypothetical protein